MGGCYDARRRCRIPAASAGNGGTTLGAIQAPATSARLTLRVPLDRAGHGRALGVVLDRFRRQRADDLGRRGNREARSGVGIAHVSVTHGSGPHDAVSIHS